MLQNGDFGHNSDLLSIADSLSKTIEECCSYVAVNKRIFSLGEDLRPVKTSSIFTLPQIKREPIGFVGVRGARNQAESSHSQINAKELLGEINSRISELEADIDAPDDDGEIYRRIVDKFVGYYAGKGYRLEPGDFSLRGKPIRNILITASTGSGKSILLDRLALWLANDWAAHKSAPVESDNRFEEWLHESFGDDAACFEGKIPLLFRCRDIGEKGSSADDLSQRILEAVFRCPAAKLAKEAEFLRDSDSSQYVFLIDGLDELPREITTERLYDALSLLFSGRKVSAENKIVTIATARGGAIDEDARAFLRNNDFATFSIVPLNNMEEADRSEFIYSFAYSWCKSQGLLETESRTRAEALRTKIRLDWAAEFRYFLKTPLELILCLTLFSNVEVFPSTECGLYLRYINARLRWRCGSANADDLLLLLSYCALKIAWGTNGRESFNSSISESTFLKWIESAYLQLGSRLESYSRRGFKTPGDAAKRDLDDLVNVHGVLLREDGNVRFERNRLTVFLAENGLALSACPRGLLMWTYAGIYRKKREEGLGDDWTTLFTFLVQDPRVGEAALHSIWKAVAESADPLAYVSNESDVFLSILVDGRIAVEGQNVWLEALLRAFCSRQISSSQLSVYRKLSTDDRYSSTIKTIEALYGESPEYHFCFTVAALDIFRIMCQGDNSKSSQTNAARILDPSGSTGMYSQMRLLHRLEMLFYFRRIDTDELAFSHCFFDGDDDDCNDAAQVVIDASFRRFCDEGMHDEAAEIARVFCELSEDALYRKAIVEAAQSGGLTVPVVVHAVVCHLQEELAGVFGNLLENDLPNSAKRFLRVLSLFGKDMNPNKENGAFDVTWIVPIIRQHYLESMRWLSENIFCSVPENKSRWFASCDEDDATALTLEDKSFDEGVAVFVEPFLRMGCALSNSEGEVSALKDLANSNDWEMLLVSVVKMALERQGRKLAIDLDDLRMAASSVLNAVEFGIITDQRALAFVGKVFYLVKDCALDADLDEFDYPGETLSILCDKGFRAEVKCELKRFRERGDAGLDDVPREFIASDGGGKETKCNVLFMFDSPETGKSYIVYTDDSTDDEGNTMVYAAIYDPKLLETNEAGDFASLKLFPIETEREWMLIERILEEMSKGAGE